MAEDKAEDKVVERRRTSRSVFGPVVLIAVGVFFLLQNLNVLPPLNWPAALQFWPLALVFVGVNVLVVQARPPLGTLLSLFVALAAVGVFGYLLLSGAPDQTLRRLGLPTVGRQLQAESFSVGAQGVTSADITLNLGNQAAEIGALPGGDNLIEGTIMTTGGVDLEPESDAGGHLSLEVSAGNQGLWFLNPLTWNDSGQAWTVAVSPDVPLDLRLNGGNGGVTADLSVLALTDLALDGDNGSFSAVLPAGDYDIEVDSGNGRMQLALPAAGAQQLQLDGGNGSVTLLLPAGVAARVEYDEGNGSVAVDDRFARVSGDADEGVYETDGYSAGGNGILLVVESGNGRVVVERP